PPGQSERSCRSVAGGTATPRQSCGDRIATRRESAPPRTHRGVVVRVWRSESTSTPPSARGDASLPPRASCSVVMHRDWRCARMRARLVHELSIMEGVVDAITEQLGDQRVALVRLEIGALAGVDLETLKFCFEVCTRGTILES